MVFVRILREQLLNVVIGLDLVQSDFEVAHRQAVLKYLLFLVDYLALDRTRWVLKVPRLVHVCVIEVYEHLVIHVGTDCSLISDAVLIQVAAATQGKFESLVTLQVAVSLKFDLGGVVEAEKLAPDHIHPFRAQVEIWVKERAVRFSAPVQTKYTGSDPVRRIWGSARFDSVEPEELFEFSSRGISIAHCFEFAGGIYQADGEREISPLLMVLLVWVK